MITVIELARGVVDYVTLNWKTYITNIYHPNTVRLTYKDIRDIVCLLYPTECREYRRGILPAKTVWLYAYVQFEFEKRGYKVEKRKMCCGKTALYIHKA